MDSGRDIEQEKGEDMVGNDERPGYALKEIAKRVMDLEEYEWTEEDEAYFNKMVRRAREIELRNMTGTWAEIGKEEKV